MGKIDEVKEILNTLRVAMSIAFGLLVIVIGSIIKRFDQNNVDILFWSGALFALTILVVIILLVLKISEKTKEIRSL